jgi:TonB family protein
MHRPSFQAEGWPNTRSASRAYHLLVVASCAFAAVAGVSQLRAQADPSHATAGGGDGTVAHVRPETVAAGTARITVTRTAWLRYALVRVATDSGTFTLTTDSATLSQWADSAAALPDPPADAAGGHAPLRICQIKADGADGAKMTFGRQPSKDGVQLVLVLFNGAWGINQPLGDHAPAVLALLRGDSVTTTGIANVADSPKHAGLVDQRAITQAIIKHGSPEPKYPSELLRAGISGEAILEFDIDTVGRADPASIRLLSATDPRFAVASWKALPRMKFEPAQVSGRKVRERVQLPFTFEIPYTGIIQSNPI